MCRPIGHDHDSLFVVKGQVKGENAAGVTSSEGNSFEKLVRCFTPVVVIKMKLRTLS